MIAITLFGVAELDADRAMVHLGVALGIGLLVGLQRQYAKQGAPDDLLAGARTFALVGLAGGLSAVISNRLDSAGVFLIALAAIGLVVVIGYAGGVRERGLGLTTEVAVIVTFLAGALAGLGELVVATAVAVATTALLALKAFTQTFVTRIDEADVKATLQFAVLAVLVLPVLPRDPIGPSPLDAASPFKIGLMVVFILGLSFVGYVLIKFVGARRGVALTGILGGLVSSTAVTLTMSERGKSNRALLRTLTMAVLLAWAIMYGRVLVEVAVVNPDLLSRVWGPLTIAGLAVLGSAAYLGVRGDETASADRRQEFANPFSLGPAIQFGLLYGVILIGSKAASDHLGQAGIYTGAVVSGLADVDAITLSMAELSRGNGVVEDRTAATAIILAAAANTLVKGAIVVALGAPRMRRLVIPPVLAAVIGSVVLAFAL